MYRIWVIWGTYLGMSYNVLIERSIQIYEQEDTLVWSTNRKEGLYIVRLGYKVVIIGGLVIDLDWWWHILWKFRMFHKLKKK